MPRAMTFQAPVNIQVGNVSSDLGENKLYQVWVAIKTALNIALALGNSRQKNDEFKSSLDYTVKLYLRSRGHGRD